ncbi:MAG: BBP7 family outer membrane beta-barrel protein [Pirellulales bacterium]
MRRFAVVVALLGIAFPSRAMADPFEHLSTGLAHYEEQIENGAAIDEQPPGKSTAPEPVPQGAESVPAPIPESGDELGFYPGDGVWEEPPMVGGCYDGCRRCGTFWGRAEYLVWWVRGANTPPLVTTSPDGTPVGTAGVLPNAQIVFGNQRINTEGSSGGRFTLGYWCDPCETLGIEDTFYFVGNCDESFFGSSNGSPILARPFFNTEAGAQDALLIAYPQIVVGDVSINSSRTVAANEVNLRRGLYIDCCRRVDILAGYRYFYLGEGLGVRTGTVSLDDQSGAPIGTTFAIEDLFNTRSQFNGGQLGVNLQYGSACWTLDLLFKLALGGVSQRVAINGSTTRTLPGEDPESFQGGVLALDSNIGTYNQTQFGVMPEIGVNLRYCWSPLWTVSLGYTFIGLTNVVRPGDQIDLRLDPRQFPPPQQAGTFPEFAFHESDLWLQGLNFGIECNF